MPTRPPPLSRERPSPPEVGPERAALEPGVALTGAGVLRAAAALHRRHLLRVTVTALVVFVPLELAELRDRKKDVIISGGENISTIEVEQAVVSHPAVLECAVIAVPDQKWGEVPKAFVTLKPGREATAEEIIEHVRGRIAHFKAPRAVEFGELPKTSTGKIQKFVLREKEWTGRERRIN